MLCSPSSSSLLYTNIPTRSWALGLSSMAARLACLPLKHTVFVCASSTHVALPTCRVQRSCLQSSCGALEEMAGERRLLVRGFPHWLRASEKTSLLRHFGATEVAVLPTRGKMVRIDSEPTHGYPTHFLLCRGTVCLPRLARRRRQRG